MLLDWSLGAQTCCCQKLPTECCLRVTRTMVGAARSGTLEAVVPLRLLSRYHQKFLETAVLLK